MKVPHCGIKNSESGLFAVKILCIPNRLAGLCIMITLAFNELTTKTIGFNFLRLNCWRITQATKKCQRSTNFTKILNQHFVLFSIVS